MIKLLQLLTEAKESFETFAENRLAGAFDETYKKISLDMTQTEFQREVGRLEVLGELLIREN
jgi:hypothetical protein